jgi:hypothetical protein
MFSFRNPEWLALVPLLALAGWYVRRWRLHAPLRAGFLLLLVLILMRPQLRWQKEGMDLFVLLDRSESTEGRVDQALPEWTKLLESGKRNREDRLRLVDYARDTLPQDVGGTVFTGDRNLTRTALALQTVLALREPARPTRVLLFTDGYSTEPLTGLVDKLLRENVPLDVRFLTEPPGEDFRLTKFDTPHRVQTSEPFLIEISVSGPEQSTAKFPLTILRNGERLTETEITLKKGFGTVRFTDRIAKAGAQRYEAMIAPPNDVHPGNNRQENWVEVVGGPRLLLVTSYENDPVATVLRSMNYEVEVVSEPKKLHPGQLAGCRGVIFNNVSAHLVSADFLASMGFFVREQGGGFLMAGGKRSFGAGGYFHSAVDPLLPVSMELKTDQRKTSVSMAIVMDRSGSMGAPVGGGMKKMDLANEGAAKAIEMLGYTDSITVMAVDSEAHIPVGMQLIKDDANKETLMAICRRITVGGGGIFTYTGLKAGWKALKETTYGTRHLILFADAADAEEPGDYKVLLEEMTKEGATVSVIALGKNTDSDAKFLEDVALRGKGRIFFTDNATELPNIFTQETVAVARSAFVEEPVPTKPSGGWAEIADKRMEWLPQLDGYNLSYKKDWASQALITADEYAAPLVAWGQRGTGRCAAVSFPLGGPASESVRQWPGYGDFIQTLGRWLLGEAVPPGLGLRQQLKGTELSLDLLFEPQWETIFAATPPRILLAEGTRAETHRELTWRRLAPGHYSVAADLSEGQLVRGVIQAGKSMLPFGPVAVGRNAEWAFDAARLDEVKQTALLSGGRELLDLKDAWKSPPAQELSDLRHWLLLLALILMLADALITRLGWKLPEWSPRRAASAPAPKPAPAVLPATTLAHPNALPTPAPKVAPIVSDPNVQLESDQRRARFARAKGK